MSHAKYRTIFIALGLAFLTVVAGAWLFGSPEAPELILPPAIEQITPLPGSQVPSQTNVEVDVPVGYRIEMFIDNFRIPDGELRFVEGTGVYSWSPSTSQVIEWGPGATSSANGRAMSSTSLPRTGGGSRGTPLSSEKRSECSCCGSFPLSFWAQSGGARSIRL